MKTIFEIADKKFEAAGFIKIGENGEYVHYIKKDVNGQWKIRLELFKSIGVRCFIHDNREMDIVVPIESDLVPVILRKYREKGWK